MKSTWLFRLKGHPFYKVVSSFKHPSLTLLPKVCPCIVICTFIILICEVVFPMNLTQKLAIVSFGNCISSEDFSIDKNPNVIDKFQKRKQKQK